MINFVNVVLVDFLPKIASFGPKKLFFKFCTVFYHIFNYFWVENVKFKKKIVSGLYNSITISSEQENRVLGVFGQKLAFFLPKKLFLTLTLTLNLNLNPNPNPILTGAFAPVAPPWIRPCMLPC